MASPLTTHVLDTARGLPAAGLSVALQRRSGETWTPISRGKTNEDGRVMDLLKPGELSAGIYRLIFDVRSYFQALGVKSFYPVVEVVFEVSDGRHHHVPLLLSPHGYSTYRGS